MAGQVGCWRLSHLDAILPLNTVNREGKPLMRWPTAVYCVIAAAVPILDLRLIQELIAGNGITAIAWGLAASVITGTAALYVILTRVNPGRWWARLLVYLLAVIVTQGEFIIFAVLSIHNPAVAAESVPNGRDLFFTYAHAGVSLATFFVVRRWVMQRTDIHCPPRRPATTIWWLMAGLAAIAASVSGKAIAEAVKDHLLDQISTGQAFNSTLHVSSGTAAQFLAVIGTNIVAGVNEEPVFIGLAILLWPYRGRITPLIPVLLLTTIARFSIHVYYASGKNVSALLTAIFIWCLIWSGTNLVLAYRTRNLLPIIVAHALLNFLAVAHGNWGTTDGPLAVAITTLAGVCAAILAVGLICLIIYVSVDLAERIINWLPCLLAKEQPRSTSPTTDQNLTGSDDPPQPDTPSPGSGANEELDPESFEAFYHLLPDWAQEQYRATVHDTNEYLKGIARGEFLTFEPRVDVPRFEALAAQTAKLCDEMLRQLSPRAALTPSWIQLPDELRAAVDNYGAMNRFRWVLAATATGTSTDVDLLKNYVRRCARWWAAIVMIHRHRPLDPDLSVAITGAPGREFMTRTTSQVIRFHWAAEMIALELGRQIQADPQFGDHLTDFTEDNVRGCIESALYYTNMLDGPPLPPYAPGMPLADHMAVEHGSVKLSFTQAATSKTLETHPWVKYDDGYAPIALLNVLMAMDRSLLAAADFALFKAKQAGAKINTGKINKGELFERVAQQCISRSLAFGGRTLPRECTIKIDLSNDDVDVNIANTDIVQIIGEVKAMEPSPKTGDIAENFALQIGDVHRQLTKRLHAMDNGTPLIDGTDTRHHGDHNTVGLGIVLHPYGVSLGDPAMLDILEPQHRHWRIAVAELHSWILVLAAFESIEELRDYLRFRHDMIEIGCHFSEECDPALAFLEGQGDRLLHQFRAGKDRCPPDRPYKPVLNGIQVDTAVAMNMPTPTSWRQWRHMFSAYTYSVELPFQFNEDGVIGLPPEHPPTVPAD